MFLHTILIFVAKLHLFEIKHTNKKPVFYEPVAGVHKHPDFIHERCYNVRGDTHSIAQWKIFLCHHVPVFLLFPSGY
jgi:hypothetical protein